VELAEACPQDSSAHPIAQVKISVAQTIKAFAASQKARREKSGYKD
jgi:hypothetical protein